MKTRNSNDRFGIYTAHESEVRKLSRKLNFSIDEILTAVQEVGFNEEEIEEYIRDRYDRSLY
jgi:signal recognition particle subunit SEC65